MANESFNETMNAVEKRKRLNNLLVCWQHKKILAMIKLIKELKNI